MEELQCQDPKVFEAVWARVMEGKPNPIALKQTRPIQTPAIPQETGNQSKDLLYRSPPETVPCLGLESQAPFLLEALCACYLALEAFGKLEKQLPQKLKPALIPLVSARKKQFNQLETAYFLLTGENASIPASLTLPAPVPADARLRHCFRQAQLWQGYYQKSAFQVEDPCLTSLYLMLESAMKEEVKEIHALVEGVFWGRRR